MSHLQKAKILIVDDELDWQDVLVRRLSKHANVANILTAATDAEARSLVAKHFFHAAVLDVRMEFENANNEQGMELLKAIYERGESTGVVMVSGFPTIERVRNSFRQYNAVDFLKKESFDVSMLVAALDECVQKSEQFLKSKREEQADLSFLSQKTSLSTFVQTLPHSMQKRFEEVVQRLIDQLAPIAYKGKDEKLETHEKRFLFSSTYWSRYFGKAVAFYIGHRESVEDLVLQLPSSMKAITRFTNQDITGIVYPLDQVSFEEFQGDS